MKVIEVLRNNSGGGEVQWYDTYSRLKPGTVEVARAYMNHGYGNLSVWVGHEVGIPGNPAVLIAPTMPEPASNIINSCDVCVGTYPVDEAWEIFMAHVRML